MTKKPISSRTRKVLSTEKGARSTRPTGRTAAGKAVARSGRDDRGARLAWLIGGGIAAVVLVLLAAGYYSDNIAQARDTAVTVGKHKISLGYYRDRLKAAALTGTDATTGTQVDAYNKESQLTDSLTEEQVYLQRSGTLGVYATQDDITAAEAQAVRAPLKDGKIADAGTYEIFLRNQLEHNGLTLDQFRTMATAAALKQKVQTTFKAAVPKQAPAVKGFELVFTSEDKGRAAQQRLEGGDVFADIAADTITDPTSGKQTPLDWTPVGFEVFPARLETVASQLQPGEVSDLVSVDPVSSSGQTQWVLLQITSRDEHHDVSESQASTIGTNKASAWFDAEKAALGAHSFVDRAKATWAATHTDLPLTAKATPTPAPARAPGAAPPVGAPPSGPAGPQAPAPTVPAPPLPGAAPAGPPPQPSAPVPGASP